MEQEIWKDIPDFETYQVSNLGQVRNKKRDRLLTAHPSARGYMHVGLYKDDKRINVYVHRLVAAAFLERGDENLEVNHIDGDKSNNRVDNLEWCTRSDNTKHAFKIGLKQPPINGSAIGVEIVETGEKFDSLRSCAKAINGDKKCIRECIRGRQDTHHDLHFREASKSEKKAPFLRDHQMDAVNRMRDGCVLNGGVGSGKSRTGLYYYFKEHGGHIEPGEYIPMKQPRDLYIITTARKRDTLEWEGEMTHFLLTTNPEVAYYKDLNVVVDSWNNIKKYGNVYGAFFIFDEDRVTGSGVWVKTFLRIAKRNRWIILSASPGDSWKDYIPVFMANGFYKTKKQFEDEHIVYSRFAKYPQIDRYIGVNKLERLRRDILVEMEFTRHTIPHHEDVFVGYDTTLYKQVIRTRWDPFKDEPIQQASGLCYILRRIVNTDESRQAKLLELLEDKPRAIIFYNFDHELEILKNLHYGSKVKIAEWNGHKHEPIPKTKRWVYLVQYTAGAEGWNCITTDTIIFFSQNYSYKTMIQAAGRIDRLNTPFRDLYYYHLKSRSGIDLAISKALASKKKFNESRWAKW